MKRICILTIYNEEGIVHPYLDYYISSLKEVVEEMIIMVNGNITKESENTLQKYTNKIYIRENKGFDVAAYQEVLNQYIEKSTLKEYDELILANDTCFGPFESFSEMFKNMDHVEVDYWGITEMESSWAHMQSYFYVFKKQTFDSVVEYICEKIEYNIEDKMLVVYQFELGLSSFMLNKGYKHESYSKLKDTDLFNWPYQQIKEGMCPIMKIRCFERYNQNKENIIATLKYIKENHKYNIKYITDFVKVKYGIIEEWDSLIENSMYKSEMNISTNKSATFDQVAQFCRDNKGLYIYGAGSRAHYIYWYYKDIFSELSGFIVSNKESNNSTFEGYPLFEISEMNKNVPILVALGHENTKEVKNTLREFNNVFYLWES